MDYGAYTANFHIFFYIPIPRTPRDFVQDFYEFKKLIKNGARLSIPGNSRAMHSFFINRQKAASSSSSLAS